MMNEVSSSTTRTYAQYAGWPRSRARYAAFLVALTLTLAGAGRGAAQDPVQWTAEFGEETIAPGTRVSIAVQAVIDPGWYFYSITQAEGGPVPSRIWLAPDQPFAPGGTVTGTEPVVRYDPNVKMEVQVHAGRVAYTLPVEVRAGVPAGANEIRIQARYQACTDRICLLPRTETISVPVTIVPLVDAAAAGAGRRPAG